MLESHSCQSSANQFSFKNFATAIGELKEDTMLGRLESDRRKFGSGVPEKVQGSGL